jgi:type IV secretory pathway VirB2 component (pilin)
MWLVESRARRFLRSATAVVLACLTVFFVQIGASSAAHADAPVGQCNGAFWGYLTQGICVTAITGGKDYSNHTQWIGSVTASQPDGAAQFLEIWGDGFYYSGRDVSKTWSVNRWVRSDSGVCAAHTDRWGVREVACISIEV